MLRSAKTVVFAILALAVWGYQPAAAGCDVISATHSADNKAEALAMSRALAAQSANQLRRSKGWSYVSMSAYRVRPDPFWKTVRPVVPKNVIYGTFVTAKTYYDLLHRRGGALRLHLRFEGLRQLGSSTSGTASDHCRCDLAARSFSAPPAFAPHACHNKG